MRTIGGRAGVIVAAVVLASTAACTAEDPTPPPPTTSSATPTSPTPTSSSPAPQPESAEDFIRRWARVDKDMQNSGDTTEFMALAKGCGACARLRDIVHGYYSAGGFIQTQGWVVTAVTKAPSGDRSRPVFTVDVSSGKTRYQEASGAPVKRLSGGHARFRFTLGRNGSSWLVLDYIEVPR